MQTEVENRDAELGIKDGDFEGDITKEETKPKPSICKAWMRLSTDPRIWHEIGFLGSFSQFVGASVFYISGLVFSRYFLLS